jgi:hypothetical protein
MYRIREVDGQDDETAEMLADLHRLTFFNSAPMPEFDQGYWWLALYEIASVGFAGVITSTHAYNAGYFSRAGVLRKHCGHALQLRLMRAMESRARNNGWNCVVSDTTDNVASANEFYSCWLPLVSATKSMGVAPHIVLEKVHQMTG